MAVNRSFEQFLKDAEERYGAKPSYQIPVSTGTSSRVGEWGGNAYQQFLEDLEKIRSGKMTVKNSKRVGPKTDADNPYAPKVRFNEPNQVKSSERQRLDAILSMNQDDDQPKQVKSGVKPYKSGGTVGNRKDQKKLGAEAAARRTVPKRVEPYQYDPEQMSGVGGKFQTEEYYTEAYGKPIKDRMDEIEQKIVDWNQGVYTPTGTVDALMREYDELNTRYAQWKADMYSEEQKKALSALTPEELKTLDEYILLRNAQLTMGLNPGERRERKRREDELQRELIQKYGSELWMLVEYRGRQVNEILTRQSQEALTEAVTKDGLAGFGAAALSVLQTYMAGPMAAAETAGQRVTRVLGLTSKYAPIDTNAPGFQIQNEKSTIREIQRKQITGDNPTKGQELLAFAYDGIMSSLDSAAAAATPGAGGIAAFLLASSAGADAVQRYTERGATAHQAVLIGIIAAVNEWLFEKISIGEFKKMQEVPLESWRDFLHNILITGGAVNASEETLTELANVQSDMWLPSNISEWASRVRELTEYFMSENGMSREEAEQLAKKTAAGEFGKQIGLAGAGGLFQGLLMGGVGSLGSVVKNGVNRYTPETLRQNQERWNAEMRQQNATIREGAFNAARLQAQQDGAAYQAANGMEQAQPEITTGAELFREEQEAAQAAAKARAEDIVEEVRAEVKTPAEAAEQIRERAVELRAADPLAAAALDNIAQQADNENRTGVTPASEMTQEGEYGTEKAGAGDNVSDGSGQWNAGLRAGEQAGGVVQGTGRAAAQSARQGQRDIARGRQNAVAALRRPKVSTKQLGLSRGTDMAYATIIPGKAWDQEMTSTADRIKRESGLDVVYVVGRMEISDGKETRGINGVINGNSIIIRADDVKYSVSQIADHEMFHDVVRQNPGIVAELRNKIIGENTRAEVREILTAYEQALRGVYDGSNAINKIYEELFADAYAGMNKFGVEAATLREEVRNGMARETQEAESEIDTYIEEQEPGPTDDWAFEEMEEDEERYSIEEEAERDLQQNGNLNFAVMYDSMMNNREYNALYRAAKRGDARAAAELIQEVTDDAYYDEIRRKYPGTILVPMMGMEGTSDNVLPLYLANMIGNRTGLPVNKDINKTSRNKMAGRSNAERLSQTLTFEMKEGEPSSLSGNHYVIVDDTINTGTTVNALARWIESNGGTVDGFVSLAKGKDNFNSIEIRKDQITELERRFGRNAVEEAIQKYGYADRIEQLTYKQAETILRRPESIGLHADTRGSRGNERKDRQGRGGGNEEEGIPYRETSERDTSRRQNQVNREATGENPDGFSIEEDDRYSVADEEYLEAVESGEDWKAERMVRQAAQDWGAVMDPETHGGRQRPLDLYHGTPLFGFTRFDPYHGRSKQTQGLIYTTTKSGVAAHYAGNDNFAFVRPVGQKFVENATDVNDIIRNAKWVTGRNFRVLSEDNRQALWNKVESEIMPLMERRENAYMAVADGFDIGQWDDVNNTFANAIDRANAPFYDVENYIAEVESIRDNRYYSEAEKQERIDEALEDLRSYLPGDLERFQEALETTRNYMGEHRDEFRESAKDLYDFYMGYDVFDAYVDLESYLKLIAEDTLLQNQNSELDLRNPEMLQEYLDQTHNVGAYHLYGKLGDNPLIIDAGKRDWLSVHAPTLDPEDKVHSTDWIAHRALEQGYTAAVIRNVYDGGDLADDYVFFNPNQVKAADPVTYDDQGNVVPISERFSDEDDIRYSVDDEEYLALAEDPEVNADELQAMVDQAAEAAMPESAIRDEDGNLLRVYHGTDAEFHVFDTRRNGGKNGTAEGFGIYLTDDPDVSAPYGERQLSLYADIKRPAYGNRKTLKRGELVRLLRESCMQEARQMVEDGGYDSINDALRDTWISNYVYTYEYPSMSGAYSATADLILRNNSNDADIVQEIMAGMGIRNYARAMDFYENILTPTTGIDGFWQVWKNSSGKESNIILAFNSNQTKLADPVTYDDDGSVIPLSERFNPENDDVRYSIAGEGAGNAPTELLETARELENMGESAGDIYAQTGWFRGGDGRWRWEIDDSNMRFFPHGDARLRRNDPDYVRYLDLFRQVIGDGIGTDAEMDELRELDRKYGGETRRLAFQLNNGSATLGDVIDHPAMFEAYPELEDMPFRFADMGPRTLGQFNPVTRDITLNPSLLGEPESTLIHEIQHAIQQAEDFARGASPEYWMGKQIGNQFKLSALQVEAEDLWREIKDLEESSGYNAYVDQMRAAADRGEITDDEAFDNTQAWERENLPQLGEMYDRYWDMVYEQDELQARIDRTPMDLYLNTYGEQEARDAASRRNLTRDQRMSTMPFAGDENTVYAEPGNTAGSNYATTDSDTELQEDEYIPQRAPGIEKLMRGVIAGLNRQFEIHRKAYQPQARRLMMDFLDRCLETGEINSDELDEVVRQLWSMGGRWNVEEEGGFDEVRRFLRRGVTLYVPEEVQHEFSDDWKNARIQLVGLGIRPTGRTSEMGIDQYWQTLTEQFPGFFSEEETDRAEMLRQILDVARRGRRVWQDNDEIDREAVEQMGADPDERYDNLRETVYDLASDFMDVAKPIHDKWAAKPHKPRRRRRTAEAAQEPTLEPAGAELFEEEEEPATTEPVQEAGPDFSYGDYMEQQQDADRTPEITTGAELFDSDEPPYGNQWDDRGERWDGTLRTIGRDDIMDFDPDMTRADFHRQNGELTPEVPGERTEAQILREESSQAADEALRDYLSREEFRATDHLDRLGVKIDGSVPVNYGMAQGLLYADRANKALLKDIRKAERRLGVTAAEKEFAHGIVAGLYTEEDIPRAMRADKVMELAQYYMDERALGEDMIRQQRVEINRQLDQRMKDLFKNVDEIVKRVPSLLRINYNTPQRNMRAIFGDDLGEQINREVFDPVARNEAERLRWINQQFDKVRRFRDSRGRQSSLNRQESGLVQMVIEGRAVAEQVASMEMEGAIRAAAEDIRRGGDPAESAREQNLTADERRIAEKYARWMEAQELLQSDKVDSVKVENAVQAYQELFNSYYDAINDFLVVHGYEPIGFIKGYAPHMQSEESVNALSKALQAFGIKADVTELDTGLAGRTKDFRPNKRWNPYFLSRMGDETNYDIQQAFESYVDYLSDILYHTDDIMKLRRMSRFFRQTYSREEIRNTIEWAMGLQDAAAEQKAEFLRDQGVIGSGSVLSDNDIAKAMDDYTEKLFDQITKTTKFGNMVMWLDNYTNLLAGKQNSFDRAMEEFLGRRALNMGSKLTRWFARSNVGGNLSSMLNQTSQIPMILAENGNRNVMQAMIDILSGKATKAGFAQESDFLTGKRDIKYLENTAAETVTDWLFKPANFMDSLVSTIAVRSAYRRGLRQGMNHEEALRFADRYGAEVMGTRMKGQKPVSFDNRNPLMQAVTMFQIEALNSWDHIGQDLPREIRRIASTQGRRKAAAALAGIILKALLAAFVINRISEEVYGGTPAPFDLMGLSANFIASGEGLSTNAWLRRLIDNGTERAFGERLFDTDRRDPQQEFDWSSAAEDLGYNVSNETPFFRNVSGLLGWGDETLPIPDIYGGVKDIVDASQNAGFLSGETAEAAGLLAAQLLPGGRQATKTIQGIQTMANGARMKGYGDNARLLYPVEDSVWNWIRGVMFGNSAFGETRDYYAGGDRGLSKDQTSNYSAMLENGATRQDALDLILGKQGETPREQYRTILDSKVSDAEKLRQVEKVMAGRWPAAWDKLQNLMDQGVDLYEWYDVYTYKQDQEGTGSGQKGRVMDYIDGMNLTDDQKDALYLYCGYAESKIDEAPWH